MAIDTVANYKAYRGITVSTWDTLLGTLIASVQAQMERYCDTKFDQATYTEKYDGGSESILLRVLPVTSITSVTVTTPSGGSVVIDSTGYSFNSDSGEVRLYGPLFGFVVADLASVNNDRQWGTYPRFPKGLRNVTVVYAAGYSQDTMPADLKQALYGMVDEVFIPIQSGTGDDKRLQSETIGDYSYTRRAVSETTDLMRQRLGPFRRLKL